MCHAHRALASHAPAMPVCTVNYLAMRKCAHCAQLPAHRDYLRNCSVGYTCMAAGRSNTDASHSTPGRGHHCHPRARATTMHTRPPHPAHRLLGAQGQAVWRIAQLGKQGMHSRCAAANITPAWPRPCSATTTCTPEQLDINMPNDNKNSPRAAGAIAANCLSTLSNWGGL